MRPPNRSAARLYTPAAAEKDCAGLPRVTNGQLYWGRVVIARGLSGLTAMLIALEQAAVEEPGTFFRGLLKGPARVLELKQ
jgi:hypothetical protein